MAESDYRFEIDSNGFLINAVFDRYTIDVTIKKVMSEI